MTQLSTSRISNGRIAAFIALAVAASAASAQSPEACNTLKATACTHTAGDPVTSSSVGIDTPQGICSGTLLATVNGVTDTQYILTAAHCISRASATPPASFSTTIYYGGLGSCVPSDQLLTLQSAAKATQSGVATVLVYDAPRTVTNPDGSTASVGTDTALVRVSGSPARGSYFSSWTTAPVANDDLVEMVGYGKTMQSTYAIGPVVGKESSDSLILFRSNDGVSRPGHSGGGLHLKSTGELVGSLSGSNCVTSPSGDPGSDNRPAVGSGRFQTVYPLLKSHLDPDNTGASSAVGYFVPAPPPDVSISTDRTSGRAGDIARLTWSATSDATCEASGGWSGSKGASGSSSVSIQVGTTDYTLTCSNRDGTTTKSLTITGTPASSSSGGSSGGGGSGAGGSGGGAFGLGLIPLLMLVRRRRR